MVRAVAIFQIGMVPWFFDMVDLQGADSRCLVGFHIRGPESQRSPSGRPVAAPGAMEMSSLSLGILVPSNWAENRTVLGS